MFSNARQLVTKAIVGFIFILLIASFALWGIEDVFRGGGRTDPVIRAGETEVNQQEFARDFQRTFQQYNQAFGGQLDLETARSIGLVDQIINDTITRALFAEKSRVMGLAATDAQIARAIREEQAFAGADGSFDRMRYEQILMQQNLSEAQFVEMIGEEINRAALISAAAGAVEAPDALARMLARFENEERVARYLVIEAGEMDAPEPSEEDLRSYYEENEQAFQAPEYRQVTLLTLSPDDLMDEVSVDEQAVRDLYEQRRDSLGTPEERTLRQLLVSSEEEAEAVEARLAEGDDLAAASQSVLGEDAVSDLGENTRQDLPEALAEAAFSADEGAIAGPVETGLGWHFIAVDGVREGDTPAFEEVRAELSDELAREEAVDAMVTLANQLDDRLASGASLEEAAAGLDLPLTEIEALDQNGRDRNGGEIPNLPGDEGFISTVFSTEAGQQSLLRESEDGSYYVLRVDEVTPSQTRPFDEVSEQAAERWSEAQRAQAAMEAAESLRSRVAENGESLESVAEEAGYELRLSDPITRSSGEGLRQVLASYLFDMEEGALEAIELNDGAIVAELREIREPELDEGAVEDRRGQLAQTLRNEMLQQYTNVLRRQFPVEVNEAQLDQLFERY